MANGSKNTQKAILVEDDGDGTELYHILLEQLHYEVEHIDQTGLPLNDLIAKVKERIKAIDPRLVVLDGQYPEGQTAVNVIQGLAEDLEGRHVLVHSADSGVIRAVQTIFGENVHAFVKTGINLKNEAKNARPFRL